jgi:hypothetical protein
MKTLPFDRLRVTRRAPKQLVRVPIPPRLSSLRQLGSPQGNLGQPMAFVQPLVWGPHEVGGAQARPERL